MVELISQHPYLSIFLGLSGLLTFLLSVSSRSGRKYPPGPPPKAFIGNLLDLPPTDKQSWPYWTAFRDKYGPITFLSIFGTNMVILQNSKVIHELLVTRASNYSDRPRLIMAGELVGHNTSMSLSAANKEWREQRKYAAKIFGSPSTVRMWAKDIDVEVRRYLLRMLEHPENMVKNVQMESASIILRMVYGYETTPGEDPLINLANRLLGDFDEAVQRGRWLVDVLPILKYVPEWMPGAYFQTVVRKHKLTRAAALEIPHEYVKAQRKSGGSRESMTSMGLDNVRLDNSQYDELQLMLGANAMYGGGSDTTATWMRNFYLAMTKNPHVQVPARQEIDRVVGLDRLPEPSDRPNLPYLEALYKEVLRWQPFVDLSVPHTAAEDDYYEGYLIPKGAIVVANLWAVMHDPNVYTDHETFNPDRFVGDNPEADPLQDIFGHGKRACPGRHLAVENLWLQMVRTLACFEIAPVKGEEPKMEFALGTLKYALPFKMHVKVRSQQHEKLIREVERVHPVSTGEDEKFLRSLPIAQASQELY